MNNEWILDKTIELAKKINDNHKMDFTELQRYLEDAYSKGIQDTIDQYAAHENDDGFYGNRR